MTRARVTGLTPLLVVSDLQRSLAFYEQLGFGEPNAWGEPPCFAMMHRDGFELMLSLVEGDATPRPNGASEVWDAYLRVTDLAAEQAALAAANIRVDKGPSDTFYNMREIEILDPDGYRWCIGQDTSDMPEVWEGTLDVGTKLRLALRIAKRDGALHVTLDSIDQGAMNLPVTAFTRHERALHFELPAIGASYDGVRNEEDGSFSGHWSQRGNQWPLVWRKVS
ncbi:MAG: VOC family protein [Acidobacteria bacterium]|nr:VOC family protein [Acidobacteriota bacterium]MBV9476710.1 VOC family protein [Acidobacteriota bacterium]